MARARMWTAARSSSRARSATFSVAATFVVAGLLTSTAGAQPVTGGTYQLKRGDTCVASAGPGAAVTLAPCELDAAGTAQSFTLVASTGAAFGVQSDANGELLDISGGSSAAGAVLITWPANGQTNQRFAINARSAGLYELRPQHATSLCIAGQPDDSVLLATCDAGAPAQAFELVEVEVEVGVGTRDCTQQELFQPRFVENLQGGPMGANAVVITGGYMMVLFARDSGGPPGILHFYDISDPRHPVLRKRIDDEHTARFREAHALPVARLGTSEYVAIQTVDGIQFWDLSDPLNAAFAGEIDLPGVEGGDYENVAWQADWQGRHLYVSGANQGLYVIDAMDPTSPELVAQVPTGRMGGFRVGPLLARGSYLVIGNMDQGGAYSVLDISRPDQPSLLGTIDGLPRLYSMTATSDRIYGAGRDGDFTIHSFEDPTSIVEVSTTRIGQDSLYVAAQDHFVFSGRQENFVKLDVSDEQNVEIIGEGTVGRSNSDHGQVTPMGNWVFVGNDHGTGSALFCHARTDDLALVAQAMFPVDGSTHQDPNVAITIVFSDYVDTSTISSSTVMIRPSGGEPLEGIYTYNFNTLSFSPSEPFEANTTFEIVMPVDGLKDVSGLSLAAEVIARFSTGDSIVIVTPPSMDAGVTGGSGGSVSGGATGGSGGMGGMTGGSGGAGASGEPVEMIDAGAGEPMTNGAAGASAPGGASERSSGGCAAIAPRAGDSDGWAASYASRLLLLSAVTLFLLRRTRVRRA